MDLQRLIGEHTVDADLLPEEPLVLDAGCRTVPPPGAPCDKGMDFCGEVFALRPKARIIGVDPGPDVVISDPRVTLVRAALVETDLGFVWLRMASFCSEVSMAPHAGLVEVPAVSMRKILSDFGTYFDLVKLDCEGCEYGVLENWPGRCAGQISIEFHDAGRGLPSNYYPRLFNGPLRDYDVVQDEVSNGEHHALLVLKP